MTDLPCSTLAERVISGLTLDSAQRQANWCLAPESARLLTILVRLGRFSRILEIGTSIGYSTLHLALGLGENAQAGMTDEIRLETIDASPDRQAVALRHLTEAGLSNTVTFLTGDALTVLQQCAALNKRYQMMFMDAHKAEYIDYFRMAGALIETGGILVADNTHSHRGQMLDFLEAVAGHADWESADLGTHSGLLVAYRR
ncbi:MAG: O-methyltransferase [Candidatus Melainabacteria bacterium]